MHIGVYIFATEYTIGIHALARTLEERGFESLFLPEHTHIPASRRTPWPGGGALPREYWHTLDPFVALSAAAAVTRELRLGTGICLVPQRDPFVTAKSVASLDLLSNGRFLFGMGGGWNVEEMENHGAQYKTRFRLLREHVLAMKAIWTQEEASFHGEFVNFDAVWAQPKPVQKPHPPVLLGGESEHTLKRVIEFCDGWFPRARGFDPVAGMGRLREVADKAGRDMASLTVTVFGAKPARETLERYAEAGITRVLLALPSDAPDAVLKRLDDLTPLLA